MTIGIFGGSFDPPHLGHAGIIQSFWQQYPTAEKLYLVPNYISPFKEKKSLSSQQILTLCHLFLKDLNGNNHIWSGEILRKGKSYTIETIRELVREHPASSFILLIGEDNAENFYQWRQSQEIAQKAEILVFRRWPNHQARHHFKILANEIIEISSTEIRNHIDMYKNFLTESVRSYIYQEELYGSTNSNQSSLSGTTN